MLPVVGIVLVYAFAGVEPLTSCKDMTISFLGRGWQSITSHSPPLSPTQQDIASVVAKVEPAVVRIEAKDSVGSGMVIDKLCYVLTCNHVVEDVPSASIMLMSGKRYEGRVVARDELADLAIINITLNGADFPAATMGDSNKLGIGEYVIAIGYSLGLEGKATVSKGVVSAFRTINSVNYIQTDAAINSGNSGGPLINLKGEVLGIANFKLVHEAVEGMSFAIAIDSAKSFITDEIERAHREEKHRKKNRL